MECLVCGSKNIKCIETKISDFLVSRIYGEARVKTGITVNLCHCNDCSFSFYDKRLTAEEEARLYRDYRGYDYQREREKYDCWYTDKVNRALNSDKVALTEQKRVIRKMLTSYIHQPIIRALDYGGNRGDTFDTVFGFREHYVYDISDVDTLPGIRKISSFAELRRYCFDFIMCNMTLEHVAYPRDFLQKLNSIGSDDTVYYLEVPSENPFMQNKFSLLKNLRMLLNPCLSSTALIKHYFYLRKQPYMPMHEHVNFFTPKALETLLQKEGFEVIAIEENSEKAVLGDALVLSAVFRKDKMRG